jgi:hypothetical protein
MKEMLAGKIQGHFSLTLSCFATSCLCWLLPENSGGRIRNDYNLDGDAVDSNDRSVWDALCDTTP